MVKIDFASSFNADYKTLIQESEELKELILYRIHLFHNNPDDTRLENHALQKRMEGKWAFSITSDIRIVYRWRGKSRVQFLAIGGHDKVYKTR